jgi:transcriptional regulator with XRE-family HTH domain
MLVMANQNDLASRLRGARLALRLTQEQLAAKAGVVVSTISKIERGVSDSPDLETIQRLAVALAIDTTELLPPTRESGERFPPPSYASLLAFAASPFGQTMTGEERDVLESLRLPPGEEPSEVLYQQLLVAYRLSRHMPPNKAKIALS